MQHKKNDIGSKQKQHLRNSMMKDKQVLANLVKFKVVDFEEIN